MCNSQTCSTLDEHVFENPSQLSQALRERAGSARQLRFTTSTESHPSDTSIPAVALPPQSNSLPAHLRLLPTPPHVHGGLSPRRVATAEYVKPAVPRHHSAPENSTFGSAKHQPRKMFHSFLNLDAPGDTQPDSQMHKEWTSGIHAPSDVKERSPTPIPLFVDQGAEDELDDLGVDMPPPRFSQEQRSPDVTSPTLVTDDEPTSPSHLRSCTSPVKFETPAIVGRKRDRNGQPLSPVIQSDTTPGTILSASVFFGDGFGNAGGAAMSLTQIYENTQAPTSPVRATGITDHPVFQRPSPNFTNGRRSSPMPALSSPIKGNYTGTYKTDPVVRSSSEPRVEYISLKESQEKRRQATGNENRETHEQDSWEDLSRDFRTRKARELVHRKVAGALSHVSAPSSTDSRVGKRRTSAAKSSSPVKARQSRRRLGPHDCNGSDESPQTPPGPDEEIGQSAEDSPDELSLVTPTARVADKYNSRDSSIQVPKTSSHPYQALSNPSTRLSSQLAPSASRSLRNSSRNMIATPRILEPVTEPQSSRESVAVMDSQPDLAADYDSMPRPKPLRFPSSPMASQYSINQTTMISKANYTSQIISSSMPPMPPRSSAEERAQDSPDEEVLEEERVPSSPPLAPLEDNLTYDEHTYDEHDEANGAADEVMDEVGISPESGITAEDTESDDAADVVDARDDVIQETLDEEQPHPHQLKKVPPGAEQDVLEPSELVAAEGATERAFLAEPRVTSAFATDYVEFATPHPPRRRRQDTVPDTDALEETQPSTVDKHWAAAQEPQNTVRDLDDTAELNHTNSVEAFQTAQETMSQSPAKHNTPKSSRELGSDALQPGMRIRSLQDMAQLPDTQLSNTEEIEFPALEGFNDEGDASEHRSSPAPPPSKRRKITYKVKRKKFRNTNINAADVMQPSEESASSVEEPEVAPTTEQPLSASAPASVHPEALAGIDEPESATKPYVRAVTLKAKTARAVPKPRKSKKGGLKSVSKELLQAIISSPAKPGDLVTNLDGETVTSAEVVPLDCNKQANVRTSNADSELDELAGPSPTPVNHSKVDTSYTTDTSLDEVLVPNRVIALWPGQNYYPATCIGRSASGQLHVRFDDGNQTCSDAINVRAFNLRCGDQVKVDAPGLKVNIYIVVGFKDKVDSLTEDFPTTDQHGYSTVVLEEKARDSLSKGQVMRSARISVPMGHIYLTSQLRARFRDRAFRFSPPTSPAKSMSRLSTPVTITDALAPPPFVRRAAAPSLLKDITPRASSVISSIEPCDGIFKNMAFAITTIAKDVDKESIARIIMRNGGEIIENGFHELFDYDTPALSASEPGRYTASSLETAPRLVLKSQFKHLGFVALITDAHSRSTKYIQALALNIPCLHLKWIHDSLRCAMPVRFDRHLLPAGVSKFLDPAGVVRSRLMEAYDPSGDWHSFDKTVKEREMLLNGFGVLLVTGKSKSEIQKRQPFVFLTHALGASAVARCADLATARQMLEADQGWQWVYVDEGEAGLEDAAAELTGMVAQRPGGGTIAPAKKSRKAGKKRKRDEHEGEREKFYITTQVKGRDVFVAGPEFVIQSLILEDLAFEMS